MLETNSKKTIVFFVLTTGIFMVAYLLSATDITDNTKITTQKPVENDEKITLLEPKVNFVQKEKEEIYSLKKVEVEKKAIILKPRHLYVKNAQQVKQETHRSQEHRERYFQMKKSIENHMRQQRMKQHILTRKGNEDV